MSRILIVFLLAVITKGETDIELRCQYRDNVVYTCMAVGLENVDENSRFSEVSGRHVGKKSNSDVQGFLVKDQNELYAIPKNTSDFFPNLIHFDVKGSPVMNISRETFQGLQKLEEIILKNNLIASLPRDVFFDLDSLKVLIISGNKLTNFHYKTFDNNINLELLSLDNNKINYFHEKLLANLMNLREISLQGNEIEELREQTFEGNKKLELVNVKGNKLKFIGPDILKNLNNLKQFNFSDNICIVKHNQSVAEVTEIFRNSCYPPEFRRFEEEIEILKASEKNLNETLQNCEISRSEKEKLAEKTLKDFQSSVGSLKNETSSLKKDLEVCSTEKNSCEIKAKKSFADCESIKKNAENFTQKLTECELTAKFSSETLNNINEVLKNATDKIEHCKLHAETLTNSIKLQKTMIDSKADEGMKKLKEKFDELEMKNSELKSDKDLLTMKFNEVREKLEAMSEDNEKLKKAFDVSNCKEKLDKCLNQLPVCSSFFINCAFSSHIFPKNEEENEYICSTKHVSACSEGMKLQSVEGTHIAHRTNYDVNVLEIKDSFFIFNNEIFEHLPSLKKLMLKNAGIESLQPKLKSQKLRSLEVEGNKIPEIYEKVFSDVKNLNSLLLEMNHIQKLNEDSFEGLVELTELSLRDNNIAELPTGVFKHLAKLTHLSLRNNKLKSLDGGLLKLNRHLEVVKFDENSNLRFIGPDLLDYSSSLRIVQFSGTCAGSFADIKDVIKSIRESCKT